MKFLEKTFDHQNQWWKYLVVIVVGFFVGQFIGYIPIMGIMVDKMITGGVTPNDLADLAALGISKNEGLLLILLPFAVSLIFTVLLIKALHKRTFAETINGTNKIRFGRIGAGIVVWATIMAVLFVSDYLINPDNYVLQFDIAKFIPLLFISIFLIPVQTTYEEVLVRGYLAQGIAVWTRNRILVILIPASLFALLHSSNPEVEEFGFWAAMPQYLISGLLFGIIAVLDDGIELAIGMHTANNVLGSLLVTFKSSALQTDAVLEQLNINPMEDTLALLAAGVIAVIYYTYRYKWKFNVLNRKIEP